MRQQSHRCLLGRPADPPSTTRQRVRGEAWFQRPDRPARQPLNAVVARPAPSAGRPRRLATWATTVFPSRAGTACPVGEAGAGRPAHGPTAALPAEAER